MEIPQIKLLLTLSEVIKYYGLKADKQNRVCCPFHEDKTPSLQLYYKTHTAYCFSSNCRTHGKSMDVIDFIMYKENCSKAEAIKKAIEMINGDNSPESQVQSLKLNADEEKSRSQFLQKLFTYFKNAVHNSKPAKEYLVSRNLDFSKIEVGYNSGQFHHGARKDEQLIKQCLEFGLLQDVGNMSKTGGIAYNVFGKWCIVFALKNGRGNTTGLYFRSTLNDKQQRHFYLKDRQGLYPEYPKSETQKLIITESIIDAATLLQIAEISSEYGLLALFGTNGLTKEHTEAVSQLNNLEEIIFFLNGDKAGREAVKKYAATLQQLKPLVKIYNVEPPQGEDVNSLAQGHDSGLFTQMLKEREFIAPETEFSFSNENKKEVSKEENSPTHEAIPNPKLEISNPFKIRYATPIATYYILGGVPKGLDNMKITLAIESRTLSGENGQKSRNKIDLYEDKQVEKLSKEVAEKLNLNKNQVETDMNTLTDLLDGYRENQAHSQESGTKNETYQLTANERTQAMELAKAKNLMELLKEKLSQTGIVAEEENKVFLFTVAASHIQENPSSALIQGSSGSGKTRLLKQIYACMPDENKKIYSRCSEKMLYNVPKYYFKNKLICFEDVDGLGEEAEYAWRELVSNGELISGVSHKDEQGHISVKEIIVCGPITSIACTTKGAIYADNMSRLFLIAIDESKVQTERINDYQAKEAAGLINKQEQKKAIQQLQNYVRLLQPYEVHNPHAINLRLPKDIKDGRRLFKLYLYFIDMITVLHQYQRQKNAQNKLIATKEDCQIAKDLMLECIMLKMDELDGSLRQFFERLKDFIKKQHNDNYEFTQREIRQELGASKTQLQRYINELKEMEYLHEIPIGGNKGYKYKIQYWDNYRKMREEVKQYLQHQIDQLKENE